MAIRGLRRDHGTSAALDKHYMIIIAATALFEAIPYVVSRLSAPQADWLLWGKRSLIR
jgi:hypothetical protein